MNIVEAKLLSLGRDSNVSHTIEVYTGSIQNLEYELLWKIGFVSLRDTNPKEFAFWRSSYREKTLILAMQEVYSIFK